MITARSARTGRESDVSKTRVTTIRQPEDQAEDLEFVARVDGIPASELIRDAIAAHLEKRRSDPDFQARLRERIEADKKILDRLAE
jgi:predicted DNA-binding protein